MTNLNKTAELSSVGLNDVLCIGANMSYKCLIENIFGETRKTITENEFVEILPDMLLMKNTKVVWHGEKLAQIVFKRFGLNGEKEHTFDEIGKSFSFSNERARQLEAKAMRILRHPRNYERYLIDA
jgi:hypothetical protein